MSRFLESSQPQIKVIYPGRFQPFHKGHAAVYNHLVQQYGGDNVFIVTSDKTDNEKSPFSFEEKKRMMVLTGINASKVVKSTQPYRAMEIVANLDPATILLFAISEKDMAEDPRFQFAPKKDGSPSYFQPFNGIAQCKPLAKHAYMITVPTFEFKVLGASANSASQIRAQFASADEATQQKIIADLFGKFDHGVYTIMRSKLAKVTPVAEASAHKKEVERKRKEYENQQAAKREKSGETYNYGNAKVTKPPVTETSMQQSLSDMQNPDPKIQQLAKAVVKMKKELAQITGVTEAAKYRRDDLEGIAHKTWTDEDGTEHKEPIGGPETGDELNRRPGAYSGRNQKRMTKAGKPTQGELRSQANTKALMKFAPVTGPKGKLPEGSVPKEKQKTPYKTMDQHREAGKAYADKVAADKKAKDAEKIGKKKLKESANDADYYDSWFKWNQDVRRAGGTTEHSGGGRYHAVGIDGEGFGIWDENTGEGFIDFSGDSPYLGNNDSLGEETVNELSPATMSNYVSAAKTEIPTSLRHASKRIHGITTAKEKVHAADVNAQLKAKGDPRMQQESLGGVPWGATNEGRFVKGPGGVPLDRQGNEKVAAKAAVVKQPLASAAGPKVTVGKYHQPRKSEAPGFGSKHIGSGSGRGTTKGQVSGLGANTHKGGKPVVTADVNGDEASTRMGKNNVAEAGRFVRGPDGNGNIVDYDRQGKPKAPKVVAPKVPAAPRVHRDSNGLTKDDYSKVWRKIEDVVGNIFPDGDPIDWLAPWLNKSGIRDYHIGEVLDKACKMNGYKDIYAYYDSFKTDDYGYNQNKQGVDEAFKVNKHANTDQVDIKDVHGKVKGKSCPTCDGSGVYQGNQRCPRCSGTGYIKPKVAESTTGQIITKMHSFARNGEVKRVTECIKQLKPFASSLNESTKESIAKALQVVKRNAK